MAAKREWAKSTNGPDELDVETMMRAMGALHSGRVELMLSPRGIGATGGMEMTATMHFDVLPGSSLPRSVVAKSNWPCSEGCTFWGHVFAGLYRLDAEIGRVYEQRELWQ